MVKNEDAARRANPRALRQAERPVIVVDDVLYSPFGGSEWQLGSRGSRRGQQQEHGGEKHKGRGSARSGARSVNGPVAASGGFRLPQASTEPCYACVATPYQEPKLLGINAAN